MLQKSSWSTEVEEVGEGEGEKQQQNKIVRIFHVEILFDLQTHHG